MTSRRPGSRPPLIQNQPHRRDNITDDALDSYRARLRRVGDEGPDIRLRLWHPALAGLSRPLRQRPCQTVAAHSRRPRPPRRSARSRRPDRRLLDLHIGYEEAESVRCWKSVCQRMRPGNRNDTECKKMRWGGTSKAPDRSMIVSTTTGSRSPAFPEEAHEYAVGPRSALAWLIDRYRGDGRQGQWNRQRPE